MVPSPVQFTVGEVHEALARTRPDQDCLIFRETRLTWNDVTRRTRQFANFLRSHDLGCRRERQDLLPSESGQDHLAIYLHNGNEYLEAMLGAFKGRVAPFNVNYRYVTEELTYLLTDARASAIVFHSRFAPTLEAVRDSVPSLRVLIQVDDDSGHPLVPGAVWYEDALASASSEPPPPASPDDLYILYTGGTTGMPKGVMWRQADALVECFGGSRTATTIEEFVAAATGRRAMIAPPFMHGAGHWVSFSTWNAGGTVIVPSVPERLDPHDVWSIVERESVDFVLIVGDAFARPLVDELRRHHHRLDSLAVLLSGGASLSAHLKAELLDLLPHAMIIDGLGSSEAGGQLTQVSASGDAGTGLFPLAANSHVLSENLDAVLDPGHEGLGWLAKSGRLALGYLGDPAKTARTYPVIDGVRYVVPGDRAVLTKDGMVDLRGRDSVTINSGGEKIFAEEVEMAIKPHPDVFDCVVTGRPSERWGQEVVAVVQLRAGSSASADDLRAEAERHLARYKIPKVFCFVDQIVRSPSGKADYRWAASVAVAAP
ncbi:MAG: acyl-CoA synthetase [Actinomycetota bacterium]